MRTLGEPPDGRKGIEREFKRGSLELAVLHLLSPGETYGYEIVTTLTEQTNGALEVTEGTLYPLLRRLEQAGFLDGRWKTQSPPGLPPRKYYRLTPAGRRELARLTDEWTTYAKAMARLLRQEREVT